MDLCDGSKMPGREKGGRGGGTSEQGFDHG